MPCKFSRLEKRWLFVCIVSHARIGNRDPQIQKGFVDALYDGGPFLQSLPAAIGQNGVLIAQVGEASELKSPPEHISLNRNRVNFIRTLSDLGFAALRDYEEVRLVPLGTHVCSTLVPQIVPNLMQFLLVNRHTVVSRSPGKF